MDKSLNRIGTDVDCSSSGSCTHYETVTFEFTNDEFEKILSAAQIYPDKALLYKMRAKNGPDHEAGITGKEIIAFNSVVHNFKKTHGLNK